MSTSAKTLVKISSFLGVLFSITTLGITQASALDVPGLPVPLKLPLDQLLDRSLELEPKIVEDSLNRNNVLLCLPLCALPTNTLASPQRLQPQPMLQNTPANPRLGSGQGQPVPATRPSFPQ